MPLRLEIKKLLSARSERVKSVELHPSENWVLASLYSGNLILWDYETQTMIKSFDVCDLPIRCAKFVVRKQWIICGCDNMNLIVYNYNTMEKMNQWEAHTDYIRYIEVHPTQPYVLSASDDMTIKLWDWEKNWDCLQVFEGHSHYVMMVRINPKDGNTFASASLDRSIKIWGLTANMHHYSLEGHEKGVNCIDYYPGGDKPYLLSGADDKTVKIWDYQTKACVQTLEGHTNNVSAVLFHTRLPVIISGSEDGTVRLWHSTTYRAETTLNYGMERVWSVSATKENNKLAVAFDEGTIVITLGQEKPISSLDTNTGKVVWAVNNDIQTASLKGITAGIPDGERLPIVPRDLGSTEIFPQGLAHNCNGRFLVVCGDGEYIIYTSQALRNKSYGSAMDFVWSSIGTGDYAIRESISRVKIFKNFKEHQLIRAPMSSAEGLFGGICLAVRGSDCVVFFDWDEGTVIRRIDVVPHQIFWNDSGELALLACDDEYYVLRFNRELVSNAIANNAVSDSGIDGSFELIHEINDKVLTGQWVGDCFLYTNTACRLNYYVGGEVMTLSHLDQTLYMLGYLPKEDHVYLFDKSMNIVSYRVLLSMLQYQTAVVRRDLNTANEILPSIPSSEYDNVARFLESQGYKREALAVSSDPDQRFDLALDLGELDLALHELESVPASEHDTTETMNKWKKLSDLALSKGNLSLMESCSWKSNDFSGLVLLYSSTANGEGMAKLASAAHESGKLNIAFLCCFLLGKIENCVTLLKESGRLPEAVFFARTYMPSMVPEIVKEWKESLSTMNARLADSIASPDTNPDLFEDYQYAIQVEEIFKKQRHQVIPANAYMKAKGDLDLDLIALVKQAGGTSQMPIVNSKEPSIEAPSAETPTNHDVGAMEARSEEIALKDVQGQMKGMSLEAVPTMISEDAGGASMEPVNHIQSSLPSSGSMPPPASPPPPSPAVVSSSTPPTPPSSATRTILPPGVLPPDTALGMETTSSVETPAPDLVSPPISQPPPVVSHSLDSDQVAAPSVERTNLEDEFDMDFGDEDLDVIDNPGDQNGLEKIDKDDVELDDEFGTEW